MLHYEYPERMLVGSNQPDITNVTGKTGRNYVASLLRRQRGVSN